MRVGALFDYDNDGDLDLYLVQGSMLGADLEPSDALIPWPKSRRKQLNDRLLRNDLVVEEDERTLRFVDVTDEVGINSRAYGMGATVGDYDNDGDVDLYVLNYGVNELWRNDRQSDGTIRFTEVAREAGVADGALERVGEFRRHRPRRRSRSVRGRVPRLCADAQQALPDRARRARLLSAQRLPAGS